MLNKNKTIWLYIEIHIFILFILILIQMLYKKLLNITVSHIVHRNKFIHSIHVIL